MTIGERVGADGWRLTGQVPYVDVHPEQLVEMIATLQLPEGGVSEHRVMVNVTAKPIEETPTAGEVWVGQAVSHFNDSAGGQIHVTLEAEVTFKQTADSIGKPFKRLTVTGGTMKWSRSAKFTRAEPARRLRDRETR